jgi:two-component system, sensor histidine kinase and response regulator
MDCQMPIMDGFEATASIRQRERNLDLSAIPIIALTANAILGDRENCLAKGMDDYLSKPFSVEQLYRVLAQWLPANTVKPKVLPTVIPVQNIQIDKKVIEQLMALREGLLPRVIYLFRTSSPALLASLEKAIVEENSDHAYKIAHSLKNSAANLGIIELVDLCRDLEAQARTGSLNSAADYLSKIKASYQLAVSVLSQYETGEPQ